MFDPVFSSMLAPESTDSFSFSISTQRILRLFASRTFTIITEVSSITTFTPPFHATAGAVARSAPTGTDARSEDRIRARRTEKPR